MAVRTEDNDTQPAQPARLRAAKPRRWPWVGVPVTLGLLGAVLAGYAVVTAGERDEVLVAAQNLPAGHVVSAEDVRVVEIAGTDQEGLAALPSHNTEQMVGHTVTSPLTEGALVTQTALAEPGDYPSPGQTIVGATLQPNQYPASLRPGHHVSAIAAQGEEPAEQTDDEQASSSQAVEAQVQTLSPAEGEGEAMTVELVVDETEARGLAHAAAADELALVQTPDGGGP